MPQIREAPKPPNKVFDLATPGHVYSKLLWELANLKRSMAEEEADAGELRFESAYHAYNFAVTAWHLSDWVWAASDDDVRKCISKFLGGRKVTKRKHLYDAIANRYRAIHICGQVANCSKHYSMWNEDPSIGVMVLRVERADAEATKGGFLFQKELAIRDGDGDSVSAMSIFKEAVRAWEQMLGNWGFIEDRYIGPDSDPPPWA